MYFTCMEWDEQSLGSTPRLLTTVYSISGGTGVGARSSVGSAAPASSRYVILGTDGVSRWGCVVGSLEVRRGTVGVRRGK